MKKIISILLIGFLLGAPTAVLAGKVTPVPAAVAKKYKIDTKFYKKYTHAYGIPIIASAKVDSSVLLKGADNARMLLKNRKFKFAKRFKKHRVRLAITGKTEKFSDMPELNGKKSGTNS